jgi:hypothetical protein
MVGIEQGGVPDKCANCIPSIQLGFLEQLVQEMKKMERSFLEQTVPEIPVSTNSIPIGEFLIIMKVGTLNGLTLVSFPF